MKHLTLLSLICLHLPLSAQETDYDTYLGMDFQAIGTSIHFAEKIRPAILLGGEVGLFPDLLDWVLLADSYISQSNTIWSKDKSASGVNNIHQLLFAHLFARWMPRAGWFELGTGLRWALYNRSGHEVDSFDFTRFLGGYFKPMFGLKRLKLGVRFDVGDMKSKSYGWGNEFVVLASPAVRFKF